MRITILWNKFDTGFWEMGLLDNTYTVKPVDVTSQLATAPQIDEINYRCEAKENKMHFKYYLDDNERRELIGTKKIGEAGCLLYEYYLRLVARSDTQVSDVWAARHFGWKKDKAKRLRLELKGAGWFRQVRSRYTDGRTGVTYYVGKRAVAKSLDGVRTP